MLANFLLFLGEDVTEVPAQRSLVFRTPSWFVELLPRANLIDLQFVGCF